MRALPTNYNRSSLIFFLLFFLPSLSFAQNINLSNGVVFDGEPYVAVNPNNSEHIVVAWMGWVDLNNQFKIKTRTSFDGGQTWSAKVELPHTVASYSSADPCLDFNSNNEVYLSFIDFTGTTPPVTGGVYLCKSSDGGLTWGIPQEVINTNFDGTKWPIDRPWLAIDKSSGATDGNIYVTSFNLNRTNAPFNPYLSVSTDDGANFTTRYVDTVNWLAGSLNPLPFCYPTISNDGRLFASYPSYVPAQNLYVQTFLATSTNAGNSIAHKTVITFNPPNNNGDFPLAKKGSPILSNPANPDHLAYLYLSAETGDLDVYLTESLDAGNNWTSPIRLNNDPIQNNRMQDLVWGDFDLDGDLVVSWRDRRNGNDSTYQASTEIWATFRDKDSVNFGPNFQLTDQTITHDTDLEEAGNDFMCIRLQDDTLSAAWGDPRDGEINIWFQRYYIDGSVLSTSLLSSEKLPEVTIFPNPVTDWVSISGFGIQQIEIFDLQGQSILVKSFEIATTDCTLDLKKLPSSNYLLRITSELGTVSKMVKKR